MYKNAFKMYHLWLCIHIIQTEQGFYSETKISKKGKQPFPLFILSLTMELYGTVLFNSESTA